MSEPIKDALPVEVEARPLEESAAPLDAALGITKARKVIAMLVAALSDTISVFTVLSPPLQWTVDVATALVLFMVLGFRWPLLPVLVVEAIPGVSAFPTWVLAVGVVVGVTPTTSGPPSQRP